MSALSEVRFGVQWAPALPGPDLKELAQDLEGLGYSSIGFPDHFFFGRQASGEEMIEPFTALGYVAAVTTTLRILPIVADNDFRHPATFARSIASLDQLSSGRVEAGIGAGWYEPEYIATGIPFDPGGTRVDRLEEALAIILKMWTQDVVSQQGQHYSVEGLRCAPKPVQVPHPPLLIGAGGPRMLGLAGRFADIVSLTTSVRGERTLMQQDMRPEPVWRKVELVRRAARDAGRDPQSLEFQVQVDTIDFEGPDPGHLWAFAGSPERMIDVINERAEMGITYFMFRERDRQKLREFGERVIAKL